MKTFGLFMLMFVLLVIFNTIFLKGWTNPEIVMQSTIIAYIIQQYITEEFKK